MVSHGKMTLPRVGAKCIALGKDHLRGWRHDFTLVAVGERSVLGKLQDGDEMQFKFSEWMIYDANDESNRNESFVDALMVLDPHFDLGREDFCRAIVKAGWTNDHALMEERRIESEQIVAEFYGHGMFHDLHGFLRSNFDIYRKSK